MSSADFVVGSGIVGAASLRVGVRRLLPTAPRWARRVSEEEAAAFVESLSNPAGSSAPALEQTPAGSTPAAPERTAPASR